MGIAQHVSKRAVRARSSTTLVLLPLADPGGREQDESHGQDRAGDRELGCDRALVAGPLEQHERAGSEDDAREVQDHPCTEDPRAIVVIERELRSQGEVRDAERGLGRVEQDDRHAGPDRESVPGEGVGRAPQRHEEEPER